MRLTPRLRQYTRIWRRADSRHAPTNGENEISFTAGLQMNGKRLPAGSCVVSWESYNPDAIVKFDNNKDINVTVQGRWLKQTSKFPQDAVGYERNKDGTRTLLEIRFGGMAQTLVFSAARN